MAESIAIQAATSDNATTSPNRRSILPSWMGTRVMAITWLLVVAFGTLIPFNFEPIEHINGISGFFSWILAILTSPTWIASNTDDISSLGTPNWINDLVLNSALYAPLGALLRIDGWQRSKSWLRQVIPAVLLVLMISWMLECTQSLMKYRIASLTDIATNSTGGLVGALLGVRACIVGKWMIFEFYKKASYLLYHLKEFLIRQRRKPYIMFIVALSNIALIGYWYYTGQGTPAPAEAGDVNLMPFSQQFKRSYDVAAVQISRSMVLYCLFAMILSLQFMRASHKKGLIWVVIAVAALAVTREVIGLKSTGESADVTEPIIALMGVGFIFVSMFLLLHAVRCSCRRKTKTHVAVERRRIPFEYENQ